MLTLEEVVLLERALTLIALSTATCVIYDHLTTLDEEIELVWKRKKWTLVQALFILNRYMGDVVQLYSATVLLRHIASDRTQGCSGYFSSIGYLVVVIFCSMQGIMIYRVSSMYNHDRRIICLLISAFAVEVIAVTVLQFVAGRHAMPVPHPVPGISICPPFVLPQWVFLIWLAPMLFELLILVLSIHMGIKYHCSTYPARSIRLSRSRNSLPYILFRDSITFPFIGLMVSTTSFVTWIRPAYYIPQMAFTILSFAPCILGCRLVLNLREAYYQPFLEEAGGEEL